MNNKLLEEGSNHVVPTDRRQLHDLETHQKVRTEQKTFGDQVERPGVTVELSAPGARPRFYSGRLAEMKWTIDSRAYYAQYHGHPIAHLEAALAAMRAAGKSAIFLAGDSSLDNKYWYKVVRCLPSSVCTCLSSCGLAVKS